MNSVLPIDLLTARRSEITIDSALAAQYEKSTPNVSIGIYAGRRSLIDCKISAMASPRGLTPRLPLP